MALPPSAILDTVSIADGIQGFSSGATGPEIYGYLSYIIMFLYIAYAFDKLYDLGPTPIIDLCTAVYTTSVAFYTIVYITTTAWVTYIDCHAITTQLYTTATTFISATTRIITNATALLLWLFHTLTSPSPSPVAIGVSTLALPAHGTIAVLHGLPSDVSPWELRGCLTRALWEQYGKRVCADDTRRGSISISGASSDSGVAGVDGFARATDTLRED